MTNPTTASGNFANRTARNTLRLALWTAAWVATMALASFGPTLLWNGNTRLTLVAVLINIAMGIGMIAANIRHLKGLDELQQKVQLDAMALTLGAGLVGGLGYALLDSTNLIATDAEIAWLIMGMGITYLVSVIIGYRRYC